MTLLFILGRARLSYCASLSAAPVLLLPAHPILRHMQLWAHATMIVLASAGEHCVAQTLGLLSEAILARFCGVPTNLTGNARLPSTSQPRLTTAGCKDLRSELLPVDAKLWASICGGAGAG